MTQAIEENNGMPFNNLFLTPKAQEGDELYPMEQQQQ